LGISNRWNEAGSGARKIEKVAPVYLSELNAKERGSGDRLESNSEVEEP